MEKKGWNRETKNVSGKSALLWGHGVRRRTGKTLTFTLPPSLQGRQRKKEGREGGEGSGMRAHSVEL
jgi:hypothetical protein